MPSNRNSAGLTEVNRLRAELAQIRRDLADLIAAVYATLAADDDHEPDPFYYLREELHTQGRDDDRGTTW